MLNLEAAELLAHCSLRAAGSNGRSTSSTRAGANCRENAQAGDQSWAADSTADWRETKSAYRNPSRSNELSDCIRLLRGEARCQGRRMRSKADVLGFRRSRSSPRRFRRLERQESTGRRIRGSRGVPEVGQLSCRVVVFVDQAAEDITAAELSGDQRLRLAIASDRWGADRSRLRCGRWRL